MLSKFLKSLGIYRIYEEWLLRQIRKNRMLGHIAVVLDGNRRWAIEKELPPTEGYKYGVKVGEGFLEWCFDLKIKTVTLYVFSNENFKRSENEVTHTLKIIENEALQLKENSKIHENKLQEAIDSLFMRNNNNISILYNISYLDTLAESFNYKKVAHICKIQKSKYINRIVKLIISFNS